MPQWSWIWGHLPLLRRYLARYPSDVFFTYALAGLAAEELPEADMFYLDLWPFSPPFLCICDADAANQVSAKHTFPKSDYLRSLFEPLMGGPSLLTMNSQEWKDWRARFNPGFAHSYLLHHHLPAIVDYVDVFGAKLRERAATGQVFPLEHLATRMTVDLILKATLDDDMDYQNTANPMVDVLRNLIRWAYLGNPLSHLNPFRPLMLKYYSGAMNRYIRRILTDRLNEIKHGQGTAALQTSKSIIALVYQIRLFLFAGHDTTTGSLIYTYHFLSQHPDILRRLQDEHTMIFGEDPASASALLKQNPNLLNQLPYTTAVIKETMRLYPVSGSIRSGVRGATLTDRHGTHYPTEGFHLLNVHPAIQSSPRVWPRPLEFLPERWLAAPGDELYPHNAAGAWRPFEQGPRNCIGQNLSLIEMRVALALTVRAVRIEPAYEEWDAMKRGGGGSLSRLGWQKKATERRTLRGQWVYPIEKGSEASNARDGYPCRVIDLGSGGGRD
ncbi:cytochrome P450 [Aspergillus sclerotiicarbonarius CBS 121057]|uniref:Cytochrome P450 n=1 Tax=Aspergillus sclerotiicarbonarius (strain CBS 121057 / IBT 28362) TaxID=1448318 RepID=A0A319EVH2_ASPSB|nr:cytochrome P450 [Aspergillus sclerotiicarbonarius CBS 121057]